MRARDPFLLLLLRLGLTWVTYLVGPSFWRIPERVCRRMVRGGPSQARHHCMQWYTGWPRLRLLEDLL